MRTEDAVIVGAGPYGLVAAAHLRAAGVEPLVFGEVMGFWKALPKGMLLRSEWESVHFTDPRNPRSLFDYQAATGRTLPRVVPMTEFARYGEWFRRESVPNVDQRMVKRIERSPGSFKVRLADGETLASRRVILATGLTNAARWPDWAEQLPRELVSHTADARDFDWLARKNVAVLGCGQSALECSALLRAVDADVEIIARQSVIHWLAYSETLKTKKTAIDKLLRPSSALGPVGINWISHLPDLYRALPDALHPFIFSQALRPAATGWLRERVNGVTYTIGETVESIQERRGRLELRLSGGGRRHVDHLVLGTGYAPRLARNRILAPELIAQVRADHGQARLTRNFETSVPGLYVIGPAADQSFGPLMDSVDGTRCAAHRVSRHVSQSARRNVFAGFRIPAASIGAAVSPALGFKSSSEQ